ncbi:uncharacterized protein G2W53_008335 [Senna tora]|uniref:Uncharacterized protein n=1 Tax=Senna tora TaxID=362788 RepID=A0A834X8J9_9FABA|nr:uncharacterized protein G2W53_008335 [Senna tora]
MKPISRDPSQSDNTPMLLLSICWSIYTQHIQHHDPFFKMVTQWVTKRTKNMATTMEEDRNQVICSYNRNSNSQRKIFMLSIRQHGHQKQLCDIVTDFHQDTNLALLRSIRLFLEH